LKDRGAGGIVLRTSIAATVGGTAAALGGGSFTNGAISAAFVHLFNDELAREWREKLTLEDATKWWRRSVPKTDLTVDVNSLRITDIYASDFTRNSREELTCVYSTLRDPDVGLVYGSVTLKLEDSNTVSFKPDTYNFELHKHSWYNIRENARNMATRIGRIWAGQGHDYSINFDGKLKVNSQRETFSPKLGY
jgi:hypothetical protein